jgi:16S rRNA processing protein RimM
MTAPEFIIVGRIRKAHGIRGEVVVETITDEPDATFASGRRVFAGTAAGDVSPSRGELHIVSTRPFNEGLLVGFAELPDRTAAEPWRGRYLLVPAGELPAPADDEIYQHELLGMTVVMRVAEHADSPDDTLAEAIVIGTVDELYELPQGLALDVRRAPPRDGETVLLNYDERTIASVDQAARVIVVTPPDGLLE